MIISLTHYLRSRLIRNLVANYAGAVVTALAPLLAIPALIRILGSEAWGLVAFVNLIVSLMLMLNTGISQALVRELAHRWADSDDGPLRAAILLRGYERLYWAAALAIALVVLPTTRWIADKWLKTPPELADLAHASVAVAVIMFVANLPASLYRGTLLAVQEHVRLNIIRTTTTVGRVGLGVVVVLLTSSVLGYLAVFVILSFIETLAMAIAAWRLMPRRRCEIAFDLAEVQATLRFSLSMSLLVVLGVATTQVDRFFVSVLLSVDQLGIYSIAVSIAFGILQLTYPLFTTMMPTLVFIGTDSRRRLLAVGNMLLTVWFAIAIFSVLYVAFGTAALTYWLGDVELAKKVSAPLGWLLLGTALNTTYNIGYTNWVSLGETRWIAWVNVLSLLVSVVLLPVTINAWGLVGATGSWLATNIIGTAFALGWLATARRKDAAR